MDSDRHLIETYNAREDAHEVAEWKRKNTNLQRYENAAKEAHKVRIMARLVHSRPVPSWEELDLASHRHLIADAESVARNPSITALELRKIYQERLVAWGDTDNPDLGVDDEISETIEQLVLEKLKATLNS